MKAFPSGIDKIVNGESGMDLRDYFACHAMQAFIMKGIIPVDGLNKKQALVSMAYESADAMMEERDK
tara:strand:- start:699 stop:899 length:201 start_codon:yes stop_codon:yes gene_type:complete